MRLEDVNARARREPEGAKARLRTMIDTATRENKKLGAYITLRTTDSSSMNAAAGPLSGLGLAVKDNVDVRGFPTTCGSGFFHQTPDEDAALVAILRSAGAHVLGKTNLGEFALDATSNNQHFGPVRNPCDNARTAGGSSGGSAAAVAAGLADLAIGTDSGGSVRIPAALCGVAGFRPTGRTWPLKGMVAPAWSVDSCGLLAKTTRDIWFAVRTLELVPRDPATCERGPIAPARIAYLADDSMGMCHRSVWDQYGRCIERLQDSGFPCEPVTLPGLTGAPYACAVIAYSEIALAHREDLRKRPEAYGDAVRPLLYLGRGFTARDYFLAQRARRALAERYFSQCRTFDLVLTPTVPFTAPRLGAEPDISGDSGALALFAYIRYTCLANLLDVPVVSILGGLAEDGLPVGIQIMGRWRRDAQLLEVASALEDTLVS